MSVTRGSPPEKRPDFPIYDLFVRPGKRLVPAKVHSPCNWLQIRENEMDPVHITFLHTRLFGVFPRWSIGATDPVARDAFYAGNFEVGIEPMALWNYDPRDVWAAGGSILLRYNFLKPGWFSPYFEGAGGGSYMKFRLEDQADGFTYPLRASLGARVPVTERTALMASVGYFHLSNAGREYPNYGINAVLIQIGVVGVP